MATYYEFPEDPDAAGADLLAVADFLIVGNSREAGEAAERVNLVFDKMPVSWLPRLDALLAEAPAGEWVDLPPEVLQRPRPTTNLSALVLLGACHPNPRMRAFCVAHLARGGEGLHFLLLRCDDADDTVRGHAYDAVERRLGMPGSAHAFVANLSILAWLRDRGRFDHSAFLDRVFTKLKGPAGARALQIAAKRSSDPVVRELASALRDG